MSDSDSLPPGWEKSYHSGTKKFYFIDHNTKTTTWDDPRIVKKPIEPLKSEGVEDESYLSMLCQEFKNTLESKNSQNENGSSTSQKYPTFDTKNKHFQNSNEAKGTHNNNNNNKNGDLTTPNNDKNHNLNDNKDHKNRKTEPDQGEENISFSEHKQVEEEEGLKLETQNNEEMTGISSLDSILSPPPQFEERKGEKIPPRSSLAKGPNKSLPKGSNASLLGKKLKAAGSNSSLLISSDHSSAHFFDENIPSEIFKPILSLNN